MFMEKKGAEVPEFTDDPIWMCDSAFLIEIMENLDQLNVQLQGREHLINEFFQSVSTFETKLRLWETQLCLGFAFVAFMELPRREFADRFTDPSARSRKWKMDFMKCTTQMQLTDRHLDGVLRLTETSLQTDVGATATAPGVSVKLLNMASVACQEHVP